MSRLKKAERKKAKLRLGLFGPSGSGKTYSALLLASGIAPWEKIAVIDTERGSADLYAHLGAFNTLTLEAPFAPERYINAIKECEAAGMEVIVIDSISHEWEGAGGLLEAHSNMPGNSYTNWKDITPRHNKFIDTILQSPAHIICCGRAKTDYALNQDSKGKMVPEKVGLKAITREGFDYEMTLAFDLTIKHYTQCSKDRTGIFMDQPSFTITQDTGKALREWLNSGAEPTEEDIKMEIRVQIKNIIRAKSIPMEALPELIGFSSAEGRSVDELQQALDILSVA